MRWGKLKGDRQPACQIQVWVRLENQFLVFLAHDPSREGRRFMKRNRMITSILLVGSALAVALTCFEPTPNRESGGLDEGRNPGEARMPESSDAFRGAFTSPDAPKAYLIASTVSPAYRPTRAQPGYRPSSVYRPQPAYRPVGTVVYSGQPAYVVRPGGQAKPAYVVRPGDQTQPGTPAESVGGLGLGAARGRGVVSTNAAGSDDSREVPPRTTPGLGSDRR